MGRWIEIARVGQVPPGTSVVVVDGDEAIALFNVGGAFHAIDNRCPHAGASLADGDLEGTTVHCPLHGWTFDVVTGVCAVARSARVHCFPVKVEGDRVLVELGTRPR